VIEKWHSGKERDENYGTANLRVRDSRVGKEIQITGYSEYRKRQQTIPKFGIPFLGNVPGMSVKKTYRSDRKDKQEESKLLPIQFHACPFCH